MWLILAFCSAALLGFYDVCKKHALSGNAVLPVLFLNTAICSLLFLPFIILSSYTGPHHHRRSDKRHTSRDGARRSHARLRRTP